MTSAFPKLDRKLIMNSLPLFSITAREKDMLLAVRNKEDTYYLCHRLADLCGVGRARGEIPLVVKILHSLDFRGYDCSSIESYLYTTLKLRIQDYDQRMELRQMWIDKLVAHYESEQVVSNV